MKQFFPKKNGLVYSLGSQTFAIFHFPGIAWARIYFAKWRGNEIPLIFLDNFFLPNHVEKDLRNEKCHQSLSAIRRRLVQKARHVKRLNFPCNARKRLREQVTTIAIGETNCSLSSLHQELEMPVTMRSSSHRNHRRRMQVYWIMETFAMQTLFYKCYDIARGWPSLFWKLIRTWQRHIPNQ